MGSYRDLVDQVGGIEVVLQDYAKEAAGSVKALRSEVASRKAAQEDLRRTQANIQSLQNQYQNLYTEYQQAVRRAQEADADEDSGGGDDADAILGQMLSVQQQIQSEQANAEKKRAEIQAIEAQIEKYKKELQEYRDNIQRKKMEIEGLQSALYQYYQSHGSAKNSFSSLGGHFGGGLASSKASFHSAAEQECSEAINDCGTLKTYADRIIMHIDEELERKENDRGYER
ncbi:MAG: hypothetical protein IJI24_09040 [Lachnospiraceae bacterium]|nr:hypothetical protein [Lachnospiraceae bacterium]